MQLLSDENFNGNIVRGLFLRQPSLNLLRVQDVNLLHVDDPEILEWAANNNRILLTHDRATMPDFAYERLFKNQKMAGMFVVSDRMSIRQAIDELLLIIEVTEQSEWDTKVLYLPLD